jgi:hypothetical protein
MYIPAAKAEALKAVRTMSLQVNVLAEIAVLF